MAHWTKSLFNPHDRYHSEGMHICWSHPSAWLSPCSRHNQHIRVRKKDVRETMLLVYLYDTTMTGFLSRIIDIYVYIVTITIVMYPLQTGILMHQLSSLVLASW